MSPDLETIEASLLVPHTFTTLRRRNKFEVRQSWPNRSFQRTPTPAGCDPLNSKR